MRLFVLAFFLIPFLSLSQDDILAKEYFKNGEFEKALTYYQSIYNKTPNNNTYLVGLVKTHQQLEQFNEAETLLLNQIDRIVYPALYVELGYNYYLKGEVDQANSNYNKAISYIDENVNYAFTIGKYFEDRSLLDQAVITYEKAMLLKPSLNFNSHLARIYGEQGNVEKMFESYLNFIGHNETYINTIKRAFNEFISEDSETEYNQMLKKILLKKIQQNPDIMWNELLSWLFVQQKEYKKAFLQEKAIFKRQPETLDRIYELAFIATNDEDYEIATEIFTYLSETAQDLDTKIDAYYNLLQIDLKTQSDLKIIEDKYTNLFNLYGKQTQTINLQISYAHFLAFYKNEPDKGIRILKESLDLPLSALEIGQVKLELGDILVSQEKFNEALINYTQIQRNLKNSTISQEARYKVARTSFFKGDFDWAESQLKVLKSSTSQLIANDALDLMLLIRDNKYEDSTQTALKLYAKADLLAFQNKTDEAIVVLNDILANHKGESIEDQALFKQGKLYETKQLYEKAEENYNLIITNFKDDILADDAYFALAEIYQYKLDQSQQAKTYYEKILFNHEDSIYFVEARKRYRLLRGDAIN
ncbi:tetratricopeptide repeat protein [Hanstruepera marina]|uniref:tetratricopeptide repeat protein n=1 Tax=Hanstruepera marina TaxID=2873265 RepID=UPI001CA609A4|nr:tetratricopeptide repeat protein [Hanstruepera marina]